jgi:hypothetical protein
MSDGAAAKRDVYVYFDSDAKVRTPSFDAKAVIENPGDAFDGRARNPLANAPFPTQFRNGTDGGHKWQKRHRVSGGRKAA